MKTFTITVNGEHLEETVKKHLDFLTTFKNVEVSEDSPILIRRHQSAIELILDCGWIDGDHHKQWVLTQVLRILYGEEAFERWLSEYNSAEEYDDWDEGIAP